MLCLWYVLHIGHSKVMAAVESVLAHNKKNQVRPLRGLGRKHAGRLRHYAHMSAPLI
jgi:hypothetical protein